MDYTKLIEQAKAAGIEEADITLDDMEEFENTGSVARYAQTVFVNRHYTKRNYECTNVVACVAEKAPNENWKLADLAALNGLQPLWIEGGVRYFGHL